MITMNKPNIATIMRDVLSIGFTGTSKHLPDTQYEALREELRLASIFFKEIHVHHGGCIEADEKFHHLCMTGAYDFHIKRIEVHWGHIEKMRAWLNVTSDHNKLVIVEHEPQDTLERNKNIAAKADTLIACPDTMYEILRDGTWATIRYARKLKRPIIKIFPDGSISRENM